MATRLFTRDEAAEYLRVDPRTLDRYIRSGRLKAHRIAGLRTLRIFESDLDALLVPVEPES